MTGLTLKLARRVMGLILRNDVNKLSQVSGLLGVDRNKLIASSIKYTRHAKAKGMPYKPIFEPRKYTKRSKGNPGDTYLKPKGSKVEKPYYAETHEGPLFEAYNTKRRITGKGKKTLGEYMLEDFKGVI
tara:strand:+ start:492 stop:878 length:387 start_codon:yes stop_codon:yes gene_type:complete